MTPMIQINFLNLRRHQVSCNYYNEDEFNTFSGNLLNEGYKNIFSTLHLNILSLSKNDDHLVQYLSSFFSARSIRNMAKS